ncbi:MAG: VCBS repeat-containing protein [Phycisphaerae bacterium]|nr:VCBS repeat-containing protein [Phycisphaerae bacterium]
MNRKGRWSTAAVTTVVLIAAISLGGPSEQEVAGELDAHRLVGKAHYENDKFAEAAAEFRRCIELKPDSAVDHFNLGLILMRAQEYQAALEALDRAQEHDPELLAVYYIRGIVHKREGRYAEAVEQLQHVIAHDPQCPGAYYNLGVCYKFMQRYEDAVAAFKKKAELSPTDPSTHYQLITLYRRLGQVDNAERHKEIYDRVKGTVDEAEKTAEALERSKYTYIIEAPRLTKDVIPRESAVRFVDVTHETGVVVQASQREVPLTVAFKRSDYDADEARRRYAPAIGGAVALGDYDADGDLDLYVVACSTDEDTAANHLWRNDGDWHFTDVTENAGVGDTGLGMDAAFGDYDNDGHLDLYVVNAGPNVLYRNKGDGTFEDTSEAARANEPHFGRKVVFVDYDHDNDLDLFIANDVNLSEPPETDSFTIPEGFGGEANTLLRNNGDGTFSGHTDAAGLLVEFAQTGDVVFADFDGDHDIDLFYANANGPSRFFANARLGKFDSGGSFSPALDSGSVAVADGDFNRDGHIDLIVVADHQLYLYTNDGSASFTGVPLELAPEDLKLVFGPTTVCVCDYNNDGWSDLLLDADGPYLLAGRGPGKFGHRTPLVKPSGLPVPRADFAVGDLDGDGDEDVVMLRGGLPRLLRNDSVDQAHWLNVKLVGKKVNRCGYGACVEIASGGHYHKQAYQDGPVHFGLGDLKGVDVVRVTWPNGVAQNVVQPKIDEVLTIEEYVKVSASCGFLYTYNGKGFELVNEILGIGPLGVPMAPGVYYPLDCTELTKIEARQLVAKDGFYELRLTEELREITYADQITLRVVDHPAELEVIPNEMFTMPPFPEDKFYAVADGRPPISAVDERGNDVLPLILAHDGRVPTFPLTHYDGLAEPHALTLDLGDLSGARRIMLYLDSWIYWAESSVGMAIAQDPRFAFAPLMLEVRDKSGAWRTVIEWVGLPTSKGLIVPVDLTGRFPGNDYHVRLATNLRVYFDRIFVSTNDEADRCRQTELPVAHADLHYRGFSRLTRDTLGYERFDYADASPTGSWDPPRGMFTRYGDVTPLLETPDDMYVIFGPGDELTMRFDARGLPKLPAGWTRDFIFYANGWVKDGDLNTKFSDTVTPLPFHGMSGYPYRDDEHYPDSPEHQQYLKTYNTRPAKSTVGSLVGPDHLARDGSGAIGE